MSKYNMYYINLTLKSLMLDALPLFIIAKDHYECDAIIDGINHELWNLGYENFVHFYKSCGEILVPSNFEPADQIERIIVLIKNNRVKILSKDRLDKMFNND